MPSPVVFQGLGQQASRMYGLFPSAGQHLGKALKHLNKDLAAANACLPAHLQVPLLSAPSAGSHQHHPQLRRALSPARSEAAWSDISAATSTA